MQRIKSFLQFQEKHYPWVLMGINIFAFGILIPWLGFYQDDWHHVFYYLQGGTEGLKNFLFTDSRPLSYLVYMPLFKLLGVNPLGWQLYTFTIRFLITLTFWHITNILWPNSKKRNAIITALFLVYPVFLLHSMSVMFALHWTMYFVYMLSVYLMLKALQSTKYRVALLVLSLLLEIFHLLMMEYFVGVELLRPFLIFVFFREINFKERLKKTLKVSAPFIIALFIYIAFRSSYNTLLGYDRNTPVVLFQLFKQPISTSFYLLQVLFQDFAEIFVTAWYDTLQPSLFSWGKRTDLAIWLGVVTFTLGWAFYFSGTKKMPPEDSIKRWAKEVIFIGFLATVFGVAPGWAVGKTVHGSNPLWNDRFAMASIFGAAMLVVGLVFLLFKNNRSPYIFLGILVSVAIGAQLRSAISYKASWEKQQKFYWQLYWRAPQIEENTAFVSDQEFLFSMGAYPTSFAINTLYNNADNFDETKYWLYVGGEHLPHGDYYQAGVPISFEKYATTFDGNIDRTLPIIFEPESGQCLRILRPQDRNNRNLSSLSEQYAGLANIDTIQRYSDQLPIEDVFGPEPKHDRCYYYEKAALANQYEDWDEVIRLWQEAEQADLLPYDGVEYVPFIQAFAHTGDWSQAEKLTVKANKITDRMSPFLCSTWRRLEYTNAPMDVRENLSKRLSCEVLLND